MEARNVVAVWLSVLYRAHPPAAEERRVAHNYVSLWPLGLVVAGLVRA
jgi:hypothetical protein